MRKMGEVLLIRQMVLNEGESVRETARRLGVSRNTVRKYLKVADPVRQVVRGRQAPVLERAAPRIDALLEEWSGRTTAKQRLTGSRIHRQLLEDGCAVGITTVRAYLREKRRRAAEVFIPLVHRPGDEAQVDFFEVTVEVDGERRKVWKFLMRLMYSGRDFVWLYERCDQVAFLDGHVRAFAHFGSVPHRLVYDNLTAAVKRRIGVWRELTDRFQALTSHYCFEPCFARVGEGHDKGGVESRGKAIRLAHLTPVPVGDSLEALASALQSDVDRFAAPKRNAENKTVAERFAEERPLMLELPAAAFEARRVLPCVSVSKKATVSLEGATYSVPTRWARLRATAYIGVSDVRLCCLGEQVEHARHRSGARSILYRHYLPELARKPQAVRQVAAELLGELGAPFALFWERLTARLEALEAARALAGVLGLIVEHGEDLVRHALERMLSEGRLDLVGLGAALRPEPAQGAVPESLRGYAVESARAADFDRLLEGGCQ